MASLNYPELLPKWTRVLHGLSFGSGMIRYQFDVRLDLLLRTIEVEALDQMKRGSLAAGWSADTQIGLSRYWVLSTYEFLRVATLRAEKRSPEGFNIEKLQSIFAQFELVRIPMAKYEIAKDRLLKKQTIELVRERSKPETPGESYSQQSKPDYHPPINFDGETGAVCWHVVDAKHLVSRAITRRQLSDALLTFF